MSILRKAFSAITLADLAALVSSSTQESGELEFKGTLPVKEPDANGARIDRWISKGDRIGDFARDRILSEVIAFANSEGGTLVLGIHETNDHPRCAERLEALPNCESLAARLSDAADDVIEPRLPYIEARGIPEDKSESGYVVLRVGKSQAGPHRLTSTRDYYVRRGEQSQKMTAREIKDLTLELARSGDRIEQKLLERSHAMAEVFNGCINAPVVGAPLIVRVTGLPLTPVRIANITSRLAELWWTGHSFSMQLGKTKYDCGHPADQFGYPPSIQLRSLQRRTDAQRRSQGVDRVLTDEALVEFALVIPSVRISDHGDTFARLHVAWVVSLVVGTLGQIERLRRAQGWGAIGVRLGY